MADFVLLTHTDGMIWQRPIGPYQVADHCRKRGLSCQVIDFSELFRPEDLEQAVYKFVDENTLAIGVSTTFYRDTVNDKYLDANTRHLLDNDPIPANVRNIFSKIRQTHPKIKLVAGGANSYLVRDNKLLDAVFHGYSEESVAKYLLSLRSGKRQIFPKFGNTENIDGNVDHFNIEELSHRFSKNDCILKGETLPIEISRGCIFKCKFCGYPLNGKKKFDYLRDPKQIRDELIFNYETYGTTNYYFTDDTFNDSTYKLENLHKILTDLPFKIKFVTYLRLDLLYKHREQVQLLQEMGLGSCYFGIETFHQRAASIIGKGMKTDLVKEFMVELHDSLWKKEISFTCSLIVGLPEEDLDSVYRSFEWFEDKPYNDLWLPLRLGIDTHYRSEFEVNYKKYGYVLEDDGNWTSPTMTYSQALKVATDFNDKHFYLTKPPATWFVFSLATHGYDIRHFQHTPTSQLPWKAFMLQRQKLFRDYKNQLMNL